MNLFLKSLDSLRNEQIYSEVRSAATILGGR